MAQNSCIDCGSPERIPETEILYARGEPNPRRLRKYTRLPEAQTGYALYHCDENYQTGFYVLQPQAANNLVLNPTFFYDLDQWVPFNARVIRTNDIAFDSGFSARISGSGDQVTLERRAYLETGVTSFIAGQPYTFSAYVWSPLAWDISDPYMGTISLADDLGNEVFSTRANRYGQWQRLSVTTVIESAAQEVFLRFNLRSQDQQENNPPHILTGDYNLPNEFIYFDMAQFEFGVEATTPFHGDSSTCQCSEGEYSWESVPHNSPSTRSKCARDGGKLVCLSDLGFEISSHTGHGAPPIRDISFPLNNRAGEYYQKSVADSRILTLTGQLCDSTLKDLECAIHGLMDQVMPGVSPCSCCGQFLLVYHHGECDDTSCEVERDLALCVTYIGGLEGSRTNNYLQNVSIQLKAHDPYWFEWPGHSSQGLTFAQVVTTPKVALISSDGTARGIPVSANNVYNTIVCGPGLNSVTIGGIFDSINEDPDQCEKNIAQWNCDHWEEFCTPGFLGTGINDLARDGKGNTLVAGSFSGPCSNIAKIYPDGVVECYGYTGGEAFAILSPFWGEVAVGSSTGLHIQDNDGQWYNYLSDGTVRGIVQDPAGNLYIFGDFTTLGGVETGSVAFFNINSGVSCADFDEAVIEPLGYTFTGGNVTSVDIDDDTGQVYLGGEFTSATPLPVDICNTSNGTRIDSRGSDQILRFTQNSATEYTLEVLYLNILARNIAESCIANGQYVRVTGQSTFGTQYTFLLSPDNASTSGIVTEDVGGIDYYAITFTVDISVVIDEPCNTLNTSLVTEFNQTVTDIQTYTPLALPGGVGIDDTLSTLSAQCVTVTEQFQGDAVELNYVAEFNGSTLEPMGSGLPYAVNVIKVNPQTHEVYAGTDNGLYIYNGLDWFEYPGSFEGVTDLDFCDDGTFAIIHDNRRASVVPDTTNVFYNGDVSPSFLELLIHGPGRVESFGECSGNKMNMCTVLQCDEVARLNFNSGDYRSNYRSNLSPSVLGGSRYDICLDKCGDNNMCLYISDDQAATKATLIWREAYWGIEALCCSRATSSLQTGGSQASALDCVQTDYLQMHREPTDEDCFENGVEQGILWHNAVDCGLWLSRGDCGTDCSEYDGGYTDGSGSTMTEPDGTIYCFDLEEIPCD